MDTEYIYIYMEMDPIYIYICICIYLYMDTIVLLSKSLRRATSLISHLTYFPKSIQSQLFKLHLIPSFVFGLIYLIFELIEPPKQTNNNHIL